MSTSEWWELDSRGAKKTKNSMYALEVPQYSRFFTLDDQIDYTTKAR